MGFQQPVQTDNEMDLHFCYSSCDIDMWHASCTCCIITIFYFYETRSIRHQPHPLQIWGMSAVSYCVIIFFSTCQKNTKFEIMKNYVFVVSSCTRVNWMMGLSGRSPTMLALSQRRAAWKLSWTQPSWPPGTSQQVGATPWPLGLYSLSGKTSYRQISWSLEAARLGVIIISPLWNLTGSAAAERPVKFLATSRLHEILQ